MSRMVRLLTIFTPKKRKRRWRFAPNDVPSQEKEDPQDCGDRVRRRDGISVVTFSPNMITYDRQDPSICILLDKCAHRQRRRAPLWWNQAFPFYSLGALC